MWIEIIKKFEWNEGGHIQVPVRPGLVDASPEMAKFALDNKLAKKANDPRKPAFAEEEKSKKGSPKNKAEEGAPENKEKGE